MNGMRAVGWCQRVMPKPRRLPLCVTSGRQSGALCGVLQGDLTAKMRGQLRNPVRAHRRQRPVQPQGQQPANLIDCPLCQHCREPAGYGVPQHGSGRVQQQCNEPTIGRASRGPLLPPRQTASGATPDLPRAGDALAVAGPQPRGAAGIRCRKPSVKASRPQFRQQRAGLGTGDRAGVGDLRQPADQRGEVQAGAAAQDRHPTRRARHFHCFQRGPAPPGGAASLGGGTHAIHRMRHDRLILRRGTRGQDTQLPIHLHRIGVDDGAAQPLRERHRQRRLPARGRAGDNQRDVTRHRSSRASSLPPPTVAR